MFTDDKCSVEDFALWIDGVMENCFKVRYLSGVGKRVCVIVILTIYNVSLLTY